MRQKEPIPFWRRTDEQTALDRGESPCSPAAGPRALDPSRKWNHVPRERVTDFLQQWIPVDVVTRSRSSHRLHGAGAAQAARFAIRRWSRHAPTTTADFASHEKKTQRIPSETDLTLSIATATWRNRETPYRDTPSASSS